MHVLVLNKMKEKETHLEFEIKASFPSVLIENDNTSHCINKCEISLYATEEIVLSLPPTSTTITEMTSSTTSSITLTTHSTELPTSTTKSRLIEN